MLSNEITISPTSQWAFQTAEVININGSVQFDRPLSNGSYLSLRLKTKFWRQNDKNTDNLGVTTDMLFMARG